MSADVAAVHRRLRDLLAREGYEAGERLGDERGLAAALGVPRSLLRRALLRLEDEGLVRRRIGRGGGIVVVDGRLERNLNTIDGLPDIARCQGVEVRTQVLRASLALAGPVQRRHLALDEGARVYELTRLRTAGRPLSLELSWLPADLFPGLVRQDLTSLYRTLRSVYGRTPEFSDESLEVTAADPAQAALLEIAEGTPLVQVRRSTTGTGGRVIELAHDFFVAERMRFHLRKYGYVRPARAAGDDHERPRR